MSKFKFPFKKQEQPAGAEEKKEPAVETAVVLVQYENGGGTMGFLNVNGVPMKRPATMKDLYRMVCEVKADIETVNASDRIIAMVAASQKQRENQAQNASNGPTTSTKPEQTA